MTRLEEMLDLVENRARKLSQHAPVPQIVPSDMLELIAEVRAALAPKLPEDGVLPELDELDWDLWSAERMCLRCGFMPGEGMERYLAIHGDDAKCVRCGDKLPSELQRPWSEQDGEWALACFKSLPSEEMRLLRKQWYSGKFLNHMAFMRARTLALSAENASLKFDVFRLVEVAKGIRRSFGFAPHSETTIQDAMVVPAEVEQGLRELRAENARLREENEDWAEKRKSTHEWYAQHYAKLHDWARKILPDPYRNQFFFCVANGLWDVSKDRGEKYMAVGGFEVHPGGYVTLKDAKGQLIVDQTRRAEDAEARVKAAERKLETAVAEP